MVALALCAAVFAAANPQANLARLHAEQAQKALAASYSYLHGWMAKRDPETGLIPQNLKSNIWTPHNSAADNYAFMVLSAYFVDQEAYEGPMRDMLDSEMLRTTRLRSLPDWLSLDTDDFARPDIDVERIVFGASEYCKDGLLPLAERIGPSPWFDRLCTMARDLCAVFPVASDFGPLPSDGAEVNGEMLQVLCRLYSATSDPQFLDAALRIADAYFFEVLPKNMDIPCHLWDFAGHEPILSTLRLNDHGNEIIGGLAEAFVAAKVYRPEKAKRYEQPFRKMLHRVADMGIAENGLWVNAINLYGVAKAGVPDTWGYLCNAYYTAWMALGEERFRNIVLRMMDAICNYPKWGGADSTADCAESAIILLNREMRPKTLAWLDKLEAEHVTRIGEDGIVEGWHGDGNSARTWLLYAQMKTCGLRIVPWRSDVLLGAAQDDQGVLTIYMRADKPWRGKLLFDRPRHRDYMGLTVNYPRLNEWPEWWVAEAGALYQLDDGKQKKLYTGYRLHEGVELSLGAGEEWLATVRLVSGFPHAEQHVALRGPRLIRGPGQARAQISVQNNAAAPVRLSLRPSMGKVEPAALSLAPHAQATVAWTGTVTGDGELKIVAQGELPVAHATLAIPVFANPNVLDFFPTPGPEEYHGLRYTWLKRREISCELNAGGCAELAVRLLWGAKNDERHGVLRVAGREIPLCAGGYDGFKPLDVPVTLEKPQEKLALTIAWDGKERAGFISSITLLRRTAHEQKTAP